jgi:hypothetical protein
VRSPETGKPLVTYQELAESVGYPDRRNVQNFLQEFEACEEDLTSYLRRKRKVDAEVVAAVTAEVRQAPLASESALCQRVAGRFPRAELSPANIHAALEQISCTVIREPLRREWETGVFHPKEDVLLQQALAVLQHPSRSRERQMAERLADAGILPADGAGEPVVVPSQQAEQIPALLTPGLVVTEIPDRIRLMVVAMTLYCWNVPLSRLGLWLGVSNSTVYQGVSGLAVALFPVVQSWIVARVQAVTVAVDEKWLKIRQQWHYWFVALDEATGLPILGSVLPTRTTWACCWVLVTLKRCGHVPRAIITDGLAG